MKQALAGGFGAAGIGSFYWPGFNGLFFDAASVSVAEGRIIGAIFMVGAALLWFMPAADR